MITTRVIPVVLWYGNQCVQTVKFQRPPRVFGSLMDAVRVYERRNVDELILLDIGAGSSPMFGEVLQYTRELFCPVTLGGGIRTLGQIAEALRSGADKVSIRTAATPQFIEAAARKFGSQAIVFALDVMKIGPNEDYNRCMAAAQDAESAGAGEILLTSVDRNGTMEGYDLDLIRSVCVCVDIPVIANGGCGKPEHMLEAIQAGAHAVAASTMFLFTETTPRDCSRYLADHGVETRVT
jgi:imidazole glycerol-phosphate synthase subunit HisF